MSNDVSLHWYIGGWYQMEQFLSRMCIGRNANEIGVRKPKGKTQVVRPKRR